MKSIDIIICVHNALEDVKKCIQSVQDHTKSAHRIVIVDDGSAEETMNYLKKIENENSNVVRIRNEKGAGYTVAANMGIRVSTAEYLILLNSDTIVTPGWVGKLLDAFDKNANLGIVGPISNVASWQSVPRLTNLNGDWFYNELPAGMTLEQYSDYIDKYIDHDIVKISLLNGFCLAVKAEVFNKIGLFDEENFPKGYGEENDFNIKAGINNIELAIVTDCYVYHAQSKSYSDKVRLELCEYADKRLKLLYGENLVKELVRDTQFNYEMIGVRARVKFIEEREKYIAEGKKLWKNKKILILLEAGSISGGANVVIQEAEKMMEMGVQVTLYNLYLNKERFEQTYPEINIPVIYGMNLNDFCECALCFDAVCATLNNTLRFFGFTGNKKVYYIQDYEPLFYKPESEEYKIAYNSYSVCEDVIRITKTKWNALKIRENCNQECNIIGPSINIDLFRPKSKRKDGIVRIAAMVRPSSGRRAPKMTMQVLKKIRSRYKKKVEIYIFGCDKENDKKFLSQECCEFEYTHLGVLRRKQILHILQKSDIFVDFSIFQAMGLTAMEAMACGCAVIVPENGGTIEFGIDEHNCLMIDTESKQKCEEAVIKLVENYGLRNFLAINAIKEVCSFYPEKSAYLFLNAVFGDDSNVELIKRKEFPKNILPSSLKELIFKCDEIYIYGAGYFAKIYASFLIEENIEFQGFVVSSNRDNPDTLLSHKVLTLPELNLMKKDRNKIGFIIAMIKKNGLEVASALTQIGYTNIYIHGYQNKV